MIGGTQRRKEFNSIRRRIRSKEKIKYVGFITKAIRDMGREMHQLLKVVLDRKVEGEFTGWIMNTR